MPQSVGFSRLKRSSASRSNRICSIRAFNSRSRSSLIRPLCAVAVKYASTFFFSVSSSNAVLRASSFFVHLCPGDTTNSIKLRQSRPLGRLFCALRGAAAATGGRGAVDGFSTFYAIWAERVDFYSTTYYNTGRRI